MAELECVEFEYLSNDRSQDLCGGGDHAGSGSSELVPSASRGTGQGESVLRYILLPLKVLLVLRIFVMCWGPCLISAEPISEAKQHHHGAITGSVMAKAAFRYLPC